jgi:dimethylargininase
MSHRFTRAIARLPGPEFADGLTRVDLGRASIDLALAQHAAYCDALRACGLDVRVLPADPAHPDGTFVEDTAIVVPGGALLTIPGAPERQGEVPPIAAALGAHFPDLARIDGTGRVDGGDICEAGTHVFIGLSHRTNEEGARQLAAWLATRGFTSSTVDIRGIGAILHLKSGMAALAGDRLVLIDELVGHPAFAGHEIVRVDADEAYGANAVQVNDRVLLASGHPKLAARLRGLGYDVLELDMSEFAKLDGGLSCLSLRF